MKTLSVFGFATLLVLVCLYSCDAQQDRKALSLPFPEVEGWERSKPRPLPGDGYSIAYNSQGKTAVTVYVYNRGLAKIQNDLTNEQVKREWTGAPAAIQDAKKAGIYSSVREEASGESTLGEQKTGQKALFARFKLTIGEQDTLSELYILPFQNHFIKVRSTCAVEMAEKEKVALTRLYSKLNALLSR